MLILILGDSHGRLDYVHQACVEAQELWGIEAAIQVGDFGFFPKIINNYLHEGRHCFPVPLHVIDGNHEDHKWLNASRENGLVTQWESSNLFVHARGTISEFGGLRIGFVGGALHADRRQEWAGQWKPMADEQPTPLRRRIPKDPIWANWVTSGDVERTLVTFNATPPHVIISHSCPASIGIGITGSLALVEDADRFIKRAGYHSGPFHDCGEGALTEIWNRLTARPSHWLFGHFHTLHTRVIEQTKFQCVGSSDNSDGTMVFRPVLFDTADCSVIVETNLRLMKSSYKRTS